MGTDPVRPAVVARRAPTARVCLVQAGVGRTHYASQKARGFVQTAPDDSPRLPFVSTRRWPNDRTVPTPRPAAAMMTCNGGCDGRRVLGRWRCRRRSNIDPPPIQYCPRAGCGQVSEFQACRDASRLWGRGRAGVRRAPDADEGKAGGCRRALFERSEFGPTPAWTRPIRIKHAVPALLSSHRRRLQRPKHPIPYTGWPKML